MSISAENIRLIFGLKLRELRQDSDYSLSKLSRLSGISKSYLNEIEKGKKYPKPEKITMLAEVFGVSYEELVSPRLNKRLAPISDLIDSNLLNELPLEFLGIEASDILGLLASAPTKFSAFVDAIIRIGRDHDVRVESLFFSVLRSYQEMHDNYFPELERTARRFRKDQCLSTASNDITKVLLSTLTKEYKYVIDLDGFCDKPQMSEVRYLFIPGQYPRLLINSNIDHKQLLFILAREVGLNLLKLEKRPFTSSWIETRSFDHVLNNFQAYYFAGALLLDERIFIKGLLDFTKKTSFAPEQVIDLMEANNSNAEMFMLRITNLVPYYFRFPHIFFTRYNHRLSGNSYVLNKVLHGSGLAKTSAANLSIKACQRWVALTTLNQLENLQQEGAYTRPICTIYRVRYSHSNNSYLVISVAHPMLPGQQINCCISVGFLINKRFKSRTHFWNDPAIAVHEVTFDWLEQHYEKIEDGLSDPEQMKYEQHLSDLRHEIGLLLT
jgi:transcriptional regulator with XRE-family HTH domain